MHLFNCATVSPCYIRVEFIRLGNCLVILALFCYELEFITSFHTPTHKTQRCKTKGTYTLAVFHTWFVPY